MSDWAAITVIFLTGVVVGMAFIAVVMFGSNRADRKERERQYRIHEQRAWEDGRRNRPPGC